jgi:hypothetical protein
MLFFFFSKKVENITRGGKEIRPFLFTDFLLPHLHQEEVGGQLLFPPTFDL